MSFFKEQYSEGVNHGTSTKAGTTEANLGVRIGQTSQESSNDYFNRTVAREAEERRLAEKQRIGY
jgi:hypothetical protein